jgi:hypothetical protein
MNRSVQRERQRLMLAAVAGVVLVGAGAGAISALVDLPVGISAEPVGAGDRLASTTGQARSAANDAARSTPHRARQAAPGATPDASRTTPPIAGARSGSHRRGDDTTRQHGDGDHDGDD